MTLSPPGPHTRGSPPPEPLAAGLLGDGDQVHVAGHQDVVPGPELAPQVAGAHPRVRGLRELPGAQAQGAPAAPWDIRSHREKSILCTVHHLCVQRQVREQILFS